MDHAKTNNKIAICGAGIAGVAMAYYLSKASMDFDVILIDKLLPLSYTTSKSGQNFRDYWPHHCMELLSERSITMMEELREQYGSDSFDMNFKGYHFISHDKSKTIFLDENDLKFRKLNEVVYDKNIIHSDHPYLDKQIEKSVFIKRAGDIDVYRMGSLLLEEARKNGVEVIQEEIVNIEEYERFELRFDSNDKLLADQLVLAPGPFLNEVGGMIDLSFPVSNILQRKFIMTDPKQVIPRDMPFTIYSDAQYIPWGVEEKTFFSKEEKFKYLLDEFPGGIHIKPESGGKIKMGWAFETKNSEPEWDPPGSDHFPQIVLTGASRFIPGLRAYAEHTPSPLVEYAGYYTRTQENWPLIGPTENENVFVIGALSGFGTMTACASAELCVKYLTKDDLPEYSQYFHPNKYVNQTILNEIKSLNTDGQL